MGKSEDLTGQRFGKLVVLRKDISDQNSKYKCPRWVCKCDCGAIVIKLGRTLKRYKVLSCGCSDSEIFTSKEKLYGVWVAIKQRCYNSNDKAYSHYGGRGICVCEEWLNSYSTFREWAYANGYSVEDSFHNCTIDRIDVDGNYCPSNCRIVSRKVQNDNTTRTSYITYNGETHTLKEWSEITGILCHTLWGRINQSGWDEIDAITTPVNTSMRNKRAKARKAHGTSTQGE